MKEELKLYINGKEVEFSTGPKILYNYKLTEMSNPTVVKNSYSKTVEIPGTEKNNDIFGHIWNLERVQYDTSGGAGFNPLKKAPFELYVNGNLSEKGYVKLNTVKKKGEQLTYNITLYGGLGSFLYSLSYDESSNTDRKRTLADLQYSYINYLGVDDADLSFRINKETVLQAWEEHIGGGGPSPEHTPTEHYNQWRIINFAPCYNGLPDDFDADKVIINRSGTTVNGHTRDTYLQYLADYIGNGGWVYNGNQVSTVTNGRGWCMGELPRALTEWETKDLRSYLQRPVVNVEYTIEAMKNPEINGGYELVLGPHFFNNSGNENPYYHDAWMTLPMLKDLEIEGGKIEEITGATMTSGQSENTLWTINFTTPAGLAKVNAARIAIEPRLALKSGASQPNELHFSRYWYSNSNCINPKTMRKYWSESVYIMQLIGRDSDRKIVSQSKAYYFSESQKFPNGASITKYFWKSGDEGTQPEYVWMKGYFKKVNGEYRFFDTNGVEVGPITFDIPTGADIETLEIKTMTAIGVDYEAKWGIIPSIDVDPVTAATYAYLYNTARRSGGGCYEPDYVVKDGLTEARIVLNLSSFYGTATDYESMFSDTFIPKEKLLATPFTPAEFLLSYAKMFGLYFYYDPSEESSNPEVFPSGVIHLIDRAEFYKFVAYDGWSEIDSYPEVVDLDKLIDRSKDMTITPAMATAKFYNFELEPVESEAGKAYEDTYGYKYGRQLVDTGYNFDSNTNSILDSNIFKSAPQVLESSPYYQRRSHATKYQPFISNGFKQVLFETAGGTVNGETEEKTLSLIPTVSPINPDGLINYDFMPKMQFHSSDNEAEDGAYVLCFSPYQTNGKHVVNSGCTYILTDDIQEMITLNGSTPCWIMSYTSTAYSSGRIAWIIDQLPVFSRTLASDTQGSKYDFRSWDFGAPKETFIPDRYTTEEGTIYYKLWRDYIRDLYNVDTRKLTCYVTLPDNPFPGALRKFYWFDNGLWRLNEVKDWNVFGLDSTLCEFIKVQNLEDYNLKQINMCPEENVYFDNKTISATDSVNTGRVEISDGGSWGFFTEEMIVKYKNGYIEIWQDGDDRISPYYGSGISTPFTVTVGQNYGPISREITLIMEKCDGTFSHFTFTQMGDGRPYVSIIAPQTSGDTRILKVETPDSQYAYAKYETYGIDPDTLEVSCSGDMFDDIYLEDNRIVMLLNRNNDRDNPSGRWGTITISGEDYDYGNTLTDSINVYQVSQFLGFTAIPSWEYYESGISAGKVVSVQSELPVKWKFTDYSDGAIIFTRLSEYSYRIIPLSANTSTASRYLSVSVENGYQQISTVCTQYGFPESPYCSVTWPYAYGSSRTFNKSGGTSTIGSIYANVQYRVEIVFDSGTAHWLTYHQSANNRFTLTASANYSGGIRSATVYVIGDGGQIQTQLYRQAG